MPRAKPKCRKTATQARSRATVDVIVEAAARVLEEHGMPGYNTNAIAARAGVSIGSVYQYFPNKDAVTVALIERFERGLSEACAATIRESRGKPLADAIASLAATLVAQHARRPALNRILEAEEARLQGAAQDDDPEAEALLTHFLAPYRAGLAVRLPQAAGDMLTIARAMADADLFAGVDAKTSAARIGRAVLAYLTWKPDPQPARSARRARA